MVFLLWLLTKIYGVPWSELYTRLMVFTFLSSFAVFYNYQIYRSWRGRNTYLEMVEISKAWGTQIGILLFCFFILKISSYYSRVVVLTWFIIAPILIFLIHLIIRWPLKVIRRKGKDLKSIVIVGANDLGMRIARRIENTPWAGIEIKGFFDDENVDSESMNKPILGNISELDDYLEKNATDYVYIALPMRDEAKIVRVLNECRTLGSELLLVPDLYTFSLFNAEPQSLGDILLLSFNPRNRAKRFFDVAFSISVLLFMSPVFLVTAILIKLEDGGPVFYGHKRVTCTGKIFRCMKFRTMCVGADRKLEEILARDPAAREEWKKGFKIKNDPRVTRIGRFLRKTSLDELPQFLNVIKGDMSVVGARPIVYEELSKYYKKNAGLYCSVKPGLTGPWQIGKRSDTENYDERVQLDSWYVLNRSFWLDFKIIVKTVLCMINGRGAY